MIAYQASQWHDLFVVAAQSAAALGGLLFVAVSLNLKEVLREPRLPPLAARSLGVLLSILLMSVFVLTPGQSRITLGAELAALGVVLVSVLTISAARTHLPVIKFGWTAATILLALASSVPMVIAGVTEMADVGGGLYWAMVQVILGFSIAIYYAWILLIEILR